MKDRGMIVTWVTDGETFQGKVSQQDNTSQQHLQRGGELEGKIIVRMEIPAAWDRQYYYKKGEKKVLVRADKLTIIGFYD